MKGKIIKIKKRPWYTLIFSIKYYTITLEHEDGSIKEYDCFSGVHRVDNALILWSLRAQNDNPEDLIGLEI